MTGTGGVGEGTLVVVPTYNERDTLPAIVDGIRRHLPAAHTLIVDDGSPDGTGLLAEQLALANEVRVLHRAAKQGLGSAYRAGFSWGLERGYARFAGMDADLSHDPASLPTLLAGLEEDDADVVLGSRYVPGGAVRNWPLRRRALSMAGNAYVRLWTGVPARDTTSGFRVFRREVLERIDVGGLRSDGYAFQIETVLRAHRAGYRVVERPITFEERRAGVSKLSGRVVVEAVWRVPVWGLTIGRAARKTVTTSSDGDAPHTGTA